MKIAVITLFSTFMLMSCNRSAQTNQPHEPVKSKREVVLENIHSRKSVRSFVEGKQVPKEDIEILLKAAMAAPTAVNKQPWRFVVINDRTTLDSLATGLPYAKMLPDVSNAIVVCGDKSVTIEGMAFWQYDCALASANILLAAEAMDLGAVWTAVYPDEKRVTHVRKILQLPENIIPLNLIPIGYPTGEDQAKDKFDSSNIHYNKW